MARQPCVVIILEHAQFEGLTAQVMDNVQFYLKNSDVVQVAKWTGVLARFQAAWQAYHEVQR